MPAKSKIFRILLSSGDLGQLLDGLCLRAETWTKTADYLESGFNPDQAYICEECSDPQEARRIAQHYTRIIAQIEHQVERQGGWA